MPCSIDNIGSDKCQSLQQRSACGSLPMLGHKQQLVHALRDTRMQGGQTALGCLEAPCRRHGAGTASLCSGLGCETASTQCLCRQTRLVCKLSLAEVPPALADSRHAQALIAVPGHMLLLIIANKVICIAGWKTRLLLSLDGLGGFDCTERQQIGTECLTC